MLSRRTLLSAAGAGALMACVPVRLWSGVAGTASSTAGGLSLARFAPHVGSRFTVTADRGRPVPLTLLEAEGRRPHPSDHPGLAGESCPSAPARTASGTRWW